MIRNRSIRLPLLVLTFGLVGSGCEPAPRKSSAKLKVVPVLATPAFTGDALLIMRTTQINSDAILITQPDSSVVPVIDWDSNMQVRTCYNYDTKARSLRLVPSNVWQKAAGPISMQQIPEPPSIYGLDIEFKGYTLNFKRSKIETQGLNAHKIFAAPTSDMAAVVSADGKPPSKGMFTGGSGFKGQHYHQLFERSTGKLIQGSTVKIPFVSRHESIGAMWSADERFIVYYDASTYQRIAIVHIPPRNQP